MLDLSIKQTTKFGYNNMLPFKYYDSIYKDVLNKLNKDLSHFENSNDECTPLPCVEEMVNSIPEDFWARKDLKILDACCGNGNFHAYIWTKTKLLNLYFNDINKKRLHNLKSLFGENINVTAKDFLQFKDEEEYDLVLANPPYAKFNNRKRVSKNHNLSRAFINKALKIVKKGGYMLFIVPNNWMSYADRNLLPCLISHYQLRHLNVNRAKKWFPKVGSSFTWFLLHKVPNTQPFKVENGYIFNDTLYARLDKGVNFIPLYYSEEVRKIFNKTINSKLPKYKVETSSYLHRYTKKDIIQNMPDKLYSYRLIHTPTQSVWSNKPHKYQGGWKVFISLTNQYQTFIDNCGMTQSIAFIRCASKQEALRIKQELDHNIYVFLNNLTRYGNFNNIRVIQNFPLLSHISLTKKEDKFVGKFISSQSTKHGKKV